MSADCSLEVMSAADAASQWSLPEESVSIIPVGSYKLPASVSLTEQSPSSRIEVELYPGNMVVDMRKSPEKEMDTSPETCKRIRLREQGEQHGPFKLLRVVPHGWLDQFR